MVRETKIIHPNKPRIAYNYPNQVKASITFFQRKVASSEKKGLGLVVIRTKAKLETQKRKLKLIEQDIAERKLLKKPRKRFL